MENKEIYSVKCIFCGKTVNLELYPSDVAKYESGEGLIQNIFPYLTPGEREILISGMCEECFDKL